MRIHARAVVVAVHKFGSTAERYAGSKYAGNVNCPGCWGCRGGVSLPGKWRGCWSCMVLGCGTPTGAGLLDVGVRRRVVARTVQVVLASAWCMRTSLCVCARVHAYEYV